MELEKKEKAKADFSLGFDSLLHSDYPEAIKFFQNYLTVVNDKDSLTKMLLEKALKLSEGNMDEESVKRELLVSC